MVDKQIKQYILATVLLLLIFIVYLVANYTVVTPQLIVSTATIGFILLYQPCAIVLDKKMRNKAIVFIMITIVAMLFAEHRAILISLDLIIASIWLLSVVINNRGANKRKMLFQAEQEVKYNFNKQQFKEKMHDFILTIEDANNRNNSSDIVKRTIHDLIDLTRNYFMYKVAFERYGRSVTSDFDIRLWNIDADDNPIPILIKNKTIYTTPWNIGRYVDVMVPDKEKFSETIKDKKYLYYKNIEICSIETGGNHRLLRQLIENDDNKINARVIDDTPIFDNCYTDGYKIFNIETNEEEGEFGYYEIALMFVLKQLLYFVKTKTPEEYNNLLKTYKNIIK